jgi:hypothetical protein
MLQEESGINDVEVLAKIPPPLGLKGIVGFDPMISHLVLVGFHTRLYCP